MPRVTEELLKKRSEHNEGCLTSLEEITLHQQELEKIELFDVFCRHLKILYLQNNIIEKMENLSKLKELEYLNMALNNVSKIENIEGCESLQKLDMTVNFIDLDNLEESCINLGRVASIRDLYLTGNPCLDWKRCREFVIATIPQLEQLDGKQITKSERIRAFQNYDELLVELYHEAEMAKINKAKKEKEYDEEDQRNREMEKNMTPEEVEKFRREEKRKFNLEPYTKDLRKEMYLEQAKTKEDDEKRKNPEKFVKKELSSMFKSNGEIRQCNEGKYPFKLREWDDPDLTFFDIEIPKFMDTSLLEVNLDPKYVSVRVKGKLTQLKFQDEVRIEGSKIQRSQTTGVLTITAQKVHHDQLIESQKQKEEKEKQELIEQQKEKERKAGKEKEDRLKLCDKYELKQLQQYEKQQTIDHTTFDDVPDLE